MPFPFSLPTTSAVQLESFYSCASHPSFLLKATTYRSVVRTTLKKHKRLPPQQQESNLYRVKDSLEAYLPYLVVLLGSCHGSGGYGIELSATRELETQWRSTLSPTVAGRELPRVRVKGLQAEYLFVLQTLAYTHTLLSRSSLLAIHRSTALTPEQRTAHIATATRHLLAAQSLHSLANSVPSPPSSPLDIQIPTSSALSSIALAEATLLIVSKDDPYTTAVAKLRDTTSKDWMISSPTIPKVRAHLFARLCLAAADHATQASSQLPNSVSSQLTRYTDDLRRTARARAVRFLGVDADLAGETGMGIAYLRAGKQELGLSRGDSSAEEDGGKKRSGGGGGGFRALKHSFSERKEDARIKDKNGDGWGLDAGRFEEGRVLVWLEEAWVKSNDTVRFSSSPTFLQTLCKVILTDRCYCRLKVNVQVVPPTGPLLASLPSGREYHSPKTYQPPSLDTQTLERMRVAPSEEELRLVKDEDESDDDDAPVDQLTGLSIGGRASNGDPIGAFPGTGADYGGNHQGYY